MVKVQNENGQGEVDPCQLPNPSRAVADKDHFGGPGQPAPQSFRPDARAKIRRVLKTAGVGGGGMIAHRQTLLVGLGLGEDGAQLDLPSLGRAIFLFAGPARQFLRHHRHARAIHFGIQDGNRIGREDWTLLQLGGHGGSDEVDQPLNLASLQAHAGLGQQVLTG